MIQKWLGRFVKQLKSFIPCLSGLEEDPKTDREEEEKKESESDSDASDEEGEEGGEEFDDSLQPVESPYVENAVEELGQVRCKGRVILGNEA